MSRTTGWIPTSIQADLQFRRIVDFGIGTGVDAQTRALCAHRFRGFPAQLLGRPIEQAREPEADGATPNLEFT